MRGARSLSPIMALAGSVCAALAGAAAFAQPYGSFRAFEQYRLTIKGGGLGVSTDETVIFSAVKQKGIGPAAYWIAERSQIDRNWCGQHGSDGHSCVSSVISKHLWIDGRGCPELIVRLAAISSMRSMSFASPNNINQSYISETPLTSLTGPTSDHEGVGASITRSELQGPLVDWWAAADAAVAHCWSETPVSLNDSGS